MPLRMFSGLLFLIPRGSCFAIGIEFVIYTENGCSE